MLSIRTQDRMALVPYKGAFITSYGDALIVAPNVDERECEDFDVKLTLGIYKTKERALEVLDEIQVAVLGKILIPDNYMPNPYSEVETMHYDRIQQLPLVYEMPKEWLND